MEVTASNLTDAETLHIDIRSKTRNIFNKEKCAALEIECEEFQSHSFAVHPIQHAKIKKNSTVTPTKDEQHEDHEPIFVPVNTTDQTHIIVGPANKTTNNQLKHLQDYQWPWNAEIFINGDLAANGILLDKSWVLVEKDLLGDILEPLHVLQVVALLGNTKSQAIIQGPNEQLARVDCTMPLNDSNVMLLRLDKQVEFSREVLPCSLPSS